MATKIVLTETDGGIQRIGGLVSKETVCCISGKVKH